MIKSTTFVVLTALVASQAFAHSGPHSIRPNELRLIEIAPNQIKWATSEEMGMLSENAHKSGRCGGFMDITDFRDLDQGAAFVSLINFDTLALSQQTVIDSLLKEVNEGSLLAIITSLSAYQNRYYSSQFGVDASKWIFDQYTKVAGSRTDVKVEQFAHSWNQPSVIATIEGSGPNKNEIVIVGGHIDSINQSMWVDKKKARAPGSDDNASGTATVLETFRILVESGLKPNRTIQFMGYAAEEVGLLGSQDIAKTYKQKGKAVASVMQLDMTMFPDSNEKIVFMDDYTDSSLTKFMGKLVDAYVKKPWALDQCGYACSDHASWTKAGYPAVMPAESTMKGMNHALHTPQDTMDRFTPSHGLDYVKLALSYAVEVAQAK